MGRGVIAIALLICACGDEPKPAGAVATSGAEQNASGAEQAHGKPPPLPAPLEGTFSLPLRIPLRAIAEQVDAQLPQHETQGMERVTPEGQSPEIVASYEIWRDPVTLRYAHGALELEVPLRYAARFSARLKSPFGGKWLKVAKNEWGSEDAPQRVTLRVRTKVKVSARWELRLSSKVGAPEHGPPPEGNICTGGSFTLCVAKASIAPELHHRLDAEIVPRMERALAEIDARLEAAAALRSRVEQFWRALATPRRFDSYDRWVLIEPRAAALELRSDGDAIAVEPAVFGRVSYHQGRPQAVPATELPDKQPLSELPGERMQLPAALAPTELQHVLDRL